MKKIPLKMRQIQKTPEKSRMIPGIRRPSARGPLRHSPFATLCPLLKVMKDQAVKPLSVLTPSHSSGITQVMWEVPPLMKTKKKQHTTVVCQVRISCQLFVCHGQLPDVPLWEGRGTEVLLPHCWLGWREQSHLLEALIKGTVLSKPSLRFQKQGF